VACRGAGSCVQGRRHFDAEPGVLCVRGHGADAGGVRQGQPASESPATADQVKQVLDKIRTDGLFPTLEAVFKRLDEPFPLGYCNAGDVSEKGPGSRSMAKRCANEGEGSDCVRSGVHVLQRMEFK
jgi:hypothetical protein